MAWYAENIDTTGASANQILSLVEAAERSGAFASPTKKGVAYLAAFAAADAQRATLTAVLKIESSAAAASSAAAEAVQALAAEAAACSEAGAQRAAAAVSAAAAIAALAEADAATQLLRAAAESAVKRVGDDGLRAAGLSAWQLRVVGYKSGDVKRLGYTARQACNAGFNRAELVAAGYNAREIPAFQIFVVKLTGKRIALNVNSTDTVEVLKRDVEDLDGTPVIEQRLIFGGKQLEDDRSLSLYGVVEGATVHQVLRLRGD